MIKTLNDYIKTGRKESYLKNDDIITEDLACDLVQRASGDLSREFDLIQGHIACDSIGTELLYQTIWRESPDHPWRYLGLCMYGEDRNLSPVHAKKYYVCSKYHAKDERKLLSHMNDAIYVCKIIQSEGQIPVAPHLYFPGFSNDDNKIEREWGIAAGIEALKQCDEMIVVIRLEEESDEEPISDGMRREIDVATSIGMEPKLYYIGEDTLEKR